MKQLNEIEISQISGGITTISPECFNEVNLLSNWWFYGQLTLEVFSINFESYCAPDVLILIDGTPLKVISCLSEKNVKKVVSVCQQ